MEATDKKRGVATRTRLSEAVDKVISLLDDLSNLNGWWYNEYRERERKDSDMLYGMRRDMFTDANTVSNLDLQNSAEVFDLHLGEPDISDSYNLSGSIKLIYEETSDFAVYRLTRDSLSVLGVSYVQMFPDTIVFEYPPRSFASVLFFMVNPEVESFVRKIAEQQPVSEEEREALNTWEYVYRKVRETKVDREIPSPFDELLYGNDLISELVTSSSPKYKSLSMVGTTTFEVGGGDLYELFIVVLRKRNKYVKYYMTSGTEMLYLFDAMLPRSDVVALLEDVSALLPSIRKVPVLVKALEQLDDEWFTKYAKLFSRKV
ncbi:MAG: hypothetical protein QXW93_00440 [Desulfurococcaceae archaeon]